MERNLELEYAAMRQFLKLMKDPMRPGGRIFDAIDTELTARQREMVTLYFYRQMPMRDIAKKLGVNVSTVSRTIARAKLRLRRALQYGKHTLLKATEDE